MLKEIYAWKKHQLYLRCFRNTDIEEGFNNSETGHPSNKIEP